MKPSTSFLFMVVVGLTSVVAALAVFYVITSSEAAGRRDGSLSFPCRNWDAMRATAMDRVLIRPARVCGRTAHRAPSWVVR
jgi:hypothetical protein